MFVGTDIKLETSHGKRLQRKDHPQRVLWTVTANGRKYTLTKFCKMLGIPYLSIRQSVLARGVDGFKEFPMIVAAARKRAKRTEAMHRCPTCGGTGRIKEPPSPVDNGGENL